MKMRWPHNRAVLSAALLLFLPSSAGAQGVPESIESQLAPKTPLEIPPEPSPGVSPKASLPSPTPPPEAEPEQSEEGKLPVETIDPSPYLPGIPGWIVLLTALIVITPLVVVALFFLRKNALITTKASGPSPFETARKKLIALRELPTETPLAEISTRISLNLRWFLSRSKSDTALYQTREEFLTDEERLRHVPEPMKGQTAEFLSELSALQYAPPSSNPEQVSSLIEKALQTLASLNQPEPTLPAAKQ